MAQKIATALVVGNVVKHTRNSGTFTAQDGQLIDYDYIEARVLTPEYDTVDVRFPSDGSIPVPAPDEQVTLRCEVRASGGNVKFTAEAVVSTLDALV